MMSIPQTIYDRLFKSQKDQADRLRRIETRLTKYLEAQGFDTEVSRASFDPKMEAVIVPSRHVTLRECLAAVPADWAGKVLPVMIGNDLVGYVKRPFLGVSQAR